MYTKGNPYGLDEDLVYSMPLRSKVSWPWGVMHDQQLLLKHVSWICCELGSMG